MAAPTLYGYIRFNSVRYAITSKVAAQDFKLGMAGTTLYGKKTTDTAGADTFTIAGKTYTAGVKGVKNPIATIGYGLGIPVVLAPVAGTPTPTTTSTGNGGVLTPGPVVVKPDPTPPTATGNAFADFIAALTLSGWFADRKSALVAYRALFGANTGHNGDPNTFKTVKVQDLKSNQDYENIIIQGSNLKGAEPHVTNFIARGNGPYGISNGGKNAVFKNGTISDISSAGVFSSGTFTGLEIYNSGGDILKPQSDFVGEWIWGYNAGYNAPNAHADFVQVASGGPVTVRKCFADMMRTANTKSNSFCQLTAPAHDFTAEDIVVDGFTIAFHEDVLRSSLDRVYFFESASSMLISSNNSDDKLGALYSAISGKPLDWKWKAPK